MSLGAARRSAPSELLPGLRCPPPRAGANLQRGSFRTNGRTWKSRSEVACSLQSGGGESTGGSFSHSRSRRSGANASNSSRSSTDSVLEIPASETRGAYEGRRDGNALDSETPSEEGFLSGIVGPLGSESGADPDEVTTSVTDSWSSHHSPSPNLREMKGSDIYKHPRFSLGKNLSEFCTWGIGGPAKYFIEVRNEKDLLLALNHCKLDGIKYVVIGKGSNCLFDDRGFNGMVILNRINFLREVGHGRFCVGSGFPFNLLGTMCSKKNFSGLEFASGIPGTVGGAVFMNAGANGQDTGQVLVSVEILDSNLEKMCLHKNKGELENSYRKSVFQSMPGCVILSATFQLADCDQARNRQIDYLERRKKSQPITNRTAGCVFRNPSNFPQSAGSIIEKLGMKNFSVGDACVSDMHANFLVNSGKSKCSDMLTLIREIKERAFETYGVELHEEVRHIPYDDCT